MTEDEEILDNEMREVMELLGGSCDIDNWIDDYFLDFEVPEDEP